ATPAQPCARPGCAPRCRPPSNNTFLSSTSILPSSAPPAQPSSATSRGTAGTAAARLSEGSQGYGLRRPRWPMVPSVPMVALPSPAPPLQPPRSMVPSLRFLPRWWDIAQVLLGVVTSLAVIAWLAVIASRGGRPVPAAPLAAAAPRCPAGLPRRGCPPAGLLLLGLHEHCKAADSLLYDFHRAYLFTSTMGDRRPPGPGGMHMGFSVTTSFGVRRLSGGGQRGQGAGGEARAEAPGDGRAGASQPARAIEEASPPTPTSSPPAPTEAPAPISAPVQPERDEVRDIWDNLFEPDDNAAGQARARHTHVHHHFYDHFHHHHHQDEQSQNADAERLVTERPVVGHGHAHGHGHSHHIGPDGIPYAVFDAHSHSHLPQDPHGGPPTGAQRPQRRGTRAPDTTTTMVCYLFITLLVASGILAIGEVIRDWWTNLAVKAKPKAH
ncbi:hypothetical protein FOCC_FOCC004367, partial [Frankliniella occidentalis]